MKKLLTIALSLLALPACDQQPEAKKVTESDANKPLPEVTSETPPATDNKLSQRSGKVIFELHCAGCHDPGDAYAATKQLALVRGKDLAVILQRTDLVPDYIKYVVRDGLLEMPPFRPTDINDAELDNLATYIIDSAKAYKAKESK